MNKFFVSVSTITDQNLKVEFFKTHCIVNDLLDNCKHVASRVRVGGMYKLDVTRKSQQALNYITMTSKSILHER